MMNGLKKYIVLVILSLCINALFGQLPVNDSAWVLQSSKSDDFSGTSINTTLWDTSYNYWDSNTNKLYNVANGAEWNYGTNDSVGGGYLYIKADTLKFNKTAAWGTFPDYNYGTNGQSLTYAYQGGVAKTKTMDYKYGYFEISAKYPSKKWPLWPAFWVWGSSCTQPSDYLNEIDIAENWSLVSYDGNKVGTNYFVTDTSCSYAYSANDAQAITLPVDSLSGGFHKFALQWNPHYMIYYFDDVPIRTVYDPTGTIIAQNDVQVILNFCIDPYKAFLPGNWNGLAVTPHGNLTPTQWPQRFVIDYFHYYTLSVDCSNGISVCQPSDYSQRKVQQYINVGGGTCTPNFNPTTSSASYTLRATDYILLDEGTAIDPSGTGYFSIETMPCPQ